MMKRMYLSGILFTILNLNLLGSQKVPAIRRTNRAFASLCSLPIALKMPEKRITTNHIFAILAKLQESASELFKNAQYQRELIQKHREKTEELLQADKESKYSSDAAQQEQDVVQAISDRLKATEHTLLGGITRCAQVVEAQGDETIYTIEKSIEGIKDQSIQNTQSTAYLIGELDHRCQYDASIKITNFQGFWRVSPHRFLQQMTHKRCFTQKQIYQFLKTLREYGLPCNPTVEEYQKLEDLLGLYNWRKQINRTPVKTKTKKRKTTCRRISPSSCSSSSSCSLTGILSFASASLPCSSSSSSCDSSFAETASSSLNNSTISAGNVSTSSAPTTTNVSALVASPPNAQGSTRMRRVSSAPQLSRLLLHLPLSPSMKNSTDSLENKEKGIEGKTTYDMNEHDFEIVERV